MCACVYLNTVPDFMSTLCNIFVFGFEIGRSRADKLDGDQVSQVHMCYTTPLLGFHANMHTHKHMNSCIHTNT